MDTQLNVLSTRRGFWGVRLPKSQQWSNRDLTLLRGKTVILQFRPPRAATVFAGKIVSGQFDEENLFVLISSALLVQPDKGVSVLVVDRIGDNLPQSTEKSRIPVIPVGARHKCQQGNPLKHPMNVVVCFELFVLIVSRPSFYCSSAASPGGGSGSIHWYQSQCFPDLINMYCHNCI
ncbi:hypothetical protein F511_33818 [Dorcoceras hygrometricum]|uniref:Uncharacterized protein n=1 Tax=Dorcoceras hygrometricum TaxID=472368 RepID=A0A2Z7BNX1_9LAMI|nr:hypothetical protein F511_33818 [Dorcoceras hygrometricum]